MCSRFTLRDASRLPESLKPILREYETMPARFNITPAEKILCLLRSDLGELRGEELFWGLLPPWAENESQVACHTVDYLSADSEAVSAHAWRKRRCLIAADGFYLWKRRGAIRNPYYFELPEGESFFIAGLWECWTNPKTRETIRSVAIVTRPAAGTAARISDVMPVVFGMDGQRWIDPLIDQPSEVKGLIADSLVEFKGVRVSRWVNDPANDSIKCIAAVG